MRTSELHRSFEAALEKEYSGAIVLGLGRNTKNMIVVNDDKLEQSITRYYGEMKQSTQESSPIQTNKDYIFVKSSLAENDLYIDHYLYTPTMFEPISKSIVWFWLFFGLTILMVALYLYYINKIINKPMVKLVRAFKRIEEGNLELNIQHNKEDEFGYLYERFNDMLINLNISIDEIYNQRIHRQNAELKQLQSQINPHFLYNCLFSIIRLIKMEKDKEAVHFTDQLAKYFQFITRNSRDTVPLENEVAHARNYAMLQLARFSDRVTVDFGELPVNIKALSVPRLIIQPIVENAFVHGLENVIEGGILRVSFLDEPEQIVVLVEDNGEDSEDAIKKLSALLSSTQDEQEISGILNVHRRLQYKYGPESGIKVSPSDLGGVKIELTIARKEASIDVPDVNRG
ncbi:histidine kinase [Paenibacillus sp. F6_3S_P_1C]|uniref:Histidine kinase n=2 Tax=Paenibacillus vandeheii TaxID=3035917 RepID=A0ABT8JAP1_9BACL|nr:histidine kinase [Paenibacillus vandeheii]